MHSSAKVLGVALLVTSVAVLLTWYAAFAEDTHGKLTVTFLSGGEVFFVTPGGSQVLIDGGSGVVRELGSVLPLYDRSLDMVIARAPDPEKTGGLVDVLSRYDVGFFGESAAHSSTPQAASLAAAVASSETRGMHVRQLSRGDVVNFGDGTYLETLFPDRDASGMSASDGCLVLKLIYGDTSFLFSCGSPAIESYLAMLDGNRLRADVVVAGSNAPVSFVGFTQPHYAVDADPCTAPASTTSTFARFSVPLVSACGAPITFISDARTVVQDTVVQE